MSSKLAAKSVVAFGATVLIGSIVAAFFFDAVTIDLFAIAAIGLGPGVSAGDRRYVRWSIVLMMYYMLIAIALMVVSWNRLDLIHVGKHTARFEDLPWLWAAFAIVAIWAAVNIVLLKRCRESSAQTL